MRRALARRAATDRQIADALHAGLPVKGTVQGAVKGGYEVRRGWSSMVGHGRAPERASRVACVPVTSTARSLDSLPNVITSLYWPGGTFIIR